MEWANTEEMSVCKLPYMAMLRTSPQDVIQFRGPHSHVPMGEASAELPLLMNHRWYCRTAALTVYVTVDITILTPC